MMIIIIIIIRHNSALHFLVQGFSKLYVDLPGYPSPCIVNDDSLRLDVRLIHPDNCLYILEVTVGLETKTVITTPIVNEMNIILSLEVSIAIMDKSNFLFYP